MTLIRKDNTDEEGEPRIRRIRKNENEKERKPGKDKKNYGLTRAGKEGGANNENKMTKD